MKRQILLVLAVIIVSSFYINAQHNAALQYLQEQAIAYMGYEKCRKW